MAPWVRKAFIDFLPRFLFIKRPDPDDEPLTWNHNQEGTKGSNSKLPISRSLTTTQDSTDDEMEDGNMGQGNTANYMHSIDHNRSIISNNVNNKPPLQQLQLHAPSCDGSLLGKSFSTIVQEFQILSIFYVYSPIIKNNSYFL